MAISSLSLTQPPLFISKPKLKLSLHPSPPFTSTLRPKLPRTKLQTWRILATPQASETTTAIETSQQIIPSADDGVDTIISTLLFIAFIALSILTVGVIYIGVTDFLQKREREKFEKDETSQKKKGGKKKKVRAKAGPRGFGQKVADDEDAVDNE